MLAEGRGLIIPPGDAAQTGQALVHLLTNPDLCQRMGKRAREYVATHHSAYSFRQALLRITGDEEGNHDLSSRCLPSPAPHITEDEEDDHDLS